MHPPSKKLGEAVTQLVDVLSSFEAGDQRRIVDAAMVLLGTDPVPRNIEASKVIASNSTTTLRTGTINVVTARLGSDSCRKILFAAAVHLSIFQGKEKWTSDEWTKLASESRDWKSSYSKQMSRDIARLVKAGEVIENSAAVFSLSSTALAEVENQFADS